jgi:hypothetical protein
VRFKCPSAYNYEAAPRRADTLEVFLLMLRTTHWRRIASVSWLTFLLGAALPARAEFESGIYVPFNDVPVISQDGAAGLVNGNAAIAFVAPTFAGVLDDDGAVASFSSTIHARGAVTLEIRLEAGGGFSGEIPLPTIPLAAFPVGGNIIVTPYLYPTVNYSGTADTASRLSVVAPFETSVEFNGSGRPAMRVVDAPAFDPQVGGPDAAAAIELSVDIEMALIFLIEIEGIPIGGPALSASVGIDVHVSALPAPALYADLTTELRGGWTFIAALPAASKHLAGGSKRILGRMAANGLATPRWSYVHALQDSETSGALLKTGAGAVLMANSRLGSTPWLSAIGSLGLPEWQRLAIAPPTGSMNAKSLVQTANGDLLAIGWIGLLSGMRVERYTAAGLPRWARTMAGPPSTLVSWNAGVATPLGGAILAGHISYSAGERRCILAEIDPMGAIVWASEVGLGAGTSGATLNAVALTSAGDILAAGTVTYQDASSSFDAALAQRNGLIVRLDAQRTVESAFALGGKLADELATLAVFADDSYAVGGSTIPTSGDAAHGAWITSFSSDDTLLWSATYAGETSGSYGHVSSLATLPDQSGVVATGGDGHPTNTTDAWLFRIDQAGMPIWFKSMRGRGEDTLTDVATSPDGVLAFGYTKSLSDVLPQPENDLWVVSTSVDGMLDFNEASGMDAVNDSAQWSRSTHVVRPLAAVAIAATLTSTTVPLIGAPTNVTSGPLTR